MASQVQEPPDSPELTSPLAADPIWIVRDGAPDWADGLMPERGGLLGAQDPGPVRGDLLLLPGLA